MENENLIAIIGMSGRFPQAESVDELWKNLLKGKECVQQFSKEELIEEGISQSEVESDEYIGVKGIIDSSNAFDADFFGYTVKDLMIIDPQARVLLEEVWKAIEDSGNVISNYNGRVGIYAGTGMNTYLLRAIQRGLVQKYDDFDIMLGSDKDLLATRVAYKLNLTGPSLTVQSTCSTSLVAVHLACQGLLSGDCDMAVAGGVSISYPIKQGYKYRKGMIFSKSGHCRPFEERSDGTIFSDGVGVVVLKRLEEAVDDGDDIYGVIKGTAINNDGNNKVGFTAPSPTGQAAVIRDCLTVADVSADTIQYVEAHGTATEIGDLLEIKAISQVYREYTSERNFCAIGSIKSNIGHLNTASGIAGFIKALLVLKHGVIPVMPNFEKENENLNLEDSPFYINRQNVELKRNGMARVAVSSFGIGGTNAHAILEEAPLSEKSVEEENEKYIFPFSAKTKSSLLMNMKKIKEWIEENKDINMGNVAMTLQTGREVFGVRRGIVSDNREDLILKLNESINEKKTVKSLKRPIYFLITGQGSQYINMAKDLYESVEYFRDIIDKGIKMIQERYQENFLKILYPDEEYSQKAQKVINNTEYAQPLIFLVSYALGRYMISLGVQPDKIIGHSLGEYVGACLADVMSFEEGLDIIYWRGKYLQSAERGTMLAVKASKKDIEDLNLKDVYISTINAPEAIVLGGSVNMIDEAKRILVSKNIICQSLNTSHAFHTPLMETAAEKFGQYLKQYNLKEPNIDLISNTTGQLVKKGQVCNYKYWKDHIVKPVLFERGVRQLLLEEDALFIEIGSGRTLIDLAKQQSAGKNQIFMNLLPGRHYKQSHYRFFLEKLAALWEIEATVKLNGFQGKKYHKIHMPTYQFDRQQFSLLEIGGEQKGNIFNNNSIHYKASINRDGVKTPYIDPRNEVEELLLGLLKENIGIENIGVMDNFFELGLSSLSASQYALLIKESIDLDIEIQDIIEAGCVSVLSQTVTEELLKESE